MRNKLLPQGFAGRLVLCFLIAAGVTTAVALSSPQDGGTIAGEYSWIETARAQNDARQAWCDANFAGDPCVELCMTNGIGLDKYCCLNPSLIGGWDNPEECDNAWVPSNVN